MIPSLSPRALVLSLAVTAAPAAAGVDLVAVAVSGPPLVTAGHLVQVSRTISEANGGTPGVFTYEYRLSGYTVATRVSDQLGSFLDVVTLPPETPPGLHAWELRVLPFKGESDLDDNAATGPDVVVLPAPAVPAILGSAAIDVYSPLGASADPAPIELDLAHALPTTLLLSWVAVVDPPAPWLELSQLSGVVAPGSTQTIAVALHALAQPQVPSVFETNIRFAAVTDPRAAVVVPVRLEIGEAKFEPGALLVGTIDAPDESDACWLDGITGMKLEVSQKSAWNPLDLELSLEHEDGSPAGTKSLAAGAKDKATFKLSHAGRHLLTVRAKGGATGSWSLATSRKLPKDATGFAKKVWAEPPGALGAKHLGFEALAGGKLVARFKPSTYISGVYTARIRTPLGAAIDLPLVYQPLTAKLVSAEIALLETGAYQLEFTAALPAAQKVKIGIEIDPPAKGTATAVVP